MLEDTWVLNNMKKVQEMLHTGQYIKMFVLNYLKGQTIAGVVHPCEIYQDFY